MDQIEMGPDVKHQLSNIKRIIKIDSRSRKLGGNKHKKTVELTISSIFGVG